MGKNALHFAFPRLHPPRAHAMDARADRDGGDGARRRRRRAPLRGFAIVAVAAGCKRVTSGAPN